MKQPLVRDILLALQLVIPPLRGGIVGVRRDHRKELSDGPGAAAIIDYQKPLCHGGVGQLGEDVAFQVAEEASLKRVRADVAAQRTATQGTGLRIAHLKLQLLPDLTTKNSRPQAKPSNKLSSGILSRILSV